MTYGRWRALLRRNVEKDDVLARDDVRDTIAVVGDWTETATGRDELRVLFKVELVGLSGRSLCGEIRTRLNTTTTFVHVSS